MDGYDDHSVLFTETKSKKLTTVAFEVNTYSFNNLITDMAVDASSPVVGSSKNRIPGAMINSIPILVRFFSPPEMPLINSVPT